MGFNCSCSREKDAMSDDESACLEKIANRDVG